MRSIRNSMILLALLSVLLSCTPALRKPGAATELPILVPDELLEQLQQVPVAEEPFPPDTCFAMTRQEVVPVVVKGQLGFTEFGWNIGVECPRIPGKHCFAKDDGVCECIDAPDPDDFEIDFGNDGLRLPISTCRLKIEKRLSIAHSGYVAGRLYCDGRCSSGKECKLRRQVTRTGAAFLLGCTCVDAN